MADKSSRLSRSEASKILFNPFVWAGAGVGIKYGAEAIANKDINSRGIEKIIEELQYEFDPKKAPGIVSSSAVKIMIGGNDLASGTQIVDGTKIRILTAGHVCKDLEFLSEDLRFFNTSIDFPSDFRVQKVKTGTSYVWGTKIGHPDLGIISFDMNDTIGRFKEGAFINIEDLSFKGMGVLKSAFKKMWCLSYPGGKPILTNGGNVEFLETIGIYKPQVTLDNQFIYRGSSGAAIFEEDSTSSIKVTGVVNGMKEWDESPILTRDNTWVTPLSAIGIDNFKDMVDRSDKNVGQ